MAYKFNLGTFKLGGTLDMANATDVVHKDGTVDNDDLAGSIDQGKLAGGITAAKLSLGHGLHNSSGATTISGSGADSGLDIQASGIKVKLNGNTLSRANTGISVNLGQCNINNLQNASDKANSSRNLTAGDGISGGGNLTADRTFAIDLSGSNTSGLAVNADGLRIKTGQGVEVDDSNGELKLDLNGSQSGIDLTNDGVKIKLNGSTLQLANNGISVNAGQININNLQNSSDKANSSRNITAGNGLTGGGNLTSDRTLSIDLSGSNTSGLDLTADGLFIKLGSNMQVDGGGNLKANEGQLNINNLQNTNDKAASARQISAGNGLTGGGNLTADRTISINLAASNPGLFFDAGDGNKLGLKSTIGGARTFSDNVTVNGHIDTDNDATSLFASCQNTITVGHSNSTVAIAGNLSVGGTTTTVNSTDLLIADKIIQVAKDANNQNNSVNSGLQFGRVHATDGAQMLYRIENSRQAIVALQGSGSGGQAKIDLVANRFYGDGSNLTNLPAGSTIAIANDESDTTCFPVFVNAATGNQALKTNANDLSFDSDDGKLTAKKLEATNKLNHAKVLSEPLFINAQGGSAPAWSGNNYAVDSNSRNDYYIFSNSHADNDTLGLPAKAQNNGRILVIKNGHASNKMRIDGNASETIEGAANITLEAGGAVTLICISSVGWFVH